MKQGTDYSETKVCGRDEAGAGLRQGKDWTEYREGVGSAGVKEGAIDASEEQASSQSEHFDLRNNLRPRGEDASRRGSWLQPCVTPMRAD